MAPGGSETPKEACMRVYVLRTFGDAACAGDAGHGRDALDEVAGALLHARSLC